MPKIKEEIRILGIDDAPFNTLQNPMWIPGLQRVTNKLLKRFMKGKILVIGTFFRGGSSLDGVLSTKITIDGDDSTKNIIEMVNKSKFKPQLKLLMLDGIAVGGFNVIDIDELFQKTGLPIIVVIRTKPDFQRIEAALKKLGKEKKFELIKKAGKVYPVEKIFMQIRGIDLDEAKDIVKMTCTKSNIPEPIRVAHIIASGVVDGQSRGRA